MGEVREVREYGASNLTNSKNSKKWFEHKEKFSLLGLTYWLVVLLPRPLLKVVVAVVSFVYFLFCKEERKNLRKFYTNLESYKNQKENKSEKKRETGAFKMNFQIWRNFYEFSLSLCDKIAIWKGHITFDDLVFENKDELFGALVGAKKGHILLLTHFGNAEALRALSSKIDKFKVVVLMYEKNVSKFLHMQKAMAGADFDVFFVDELDVGKMLTLSKLVENGTHVGLMGDRVALGGEKNVSAAFFGREGARFSSGGYLLAEILQTRVTTMWAVRCNGGYKVGGDGVNYDIKTGEMFWRDEPRSERVRLAMERFLRVSEGVVAKTPSQWFNFFKFWA